MDDAFFFVDGAYKCFLYGYEKFAFIGCCNDKEYVDCTIVNGSHFTQCAVGNIVDGVANEVVVGGSLFVIFNIVALGIENL